MEPTADRQRLQDVFQSFRRVHQVFYQQLMRAAQPHGITPGQMMVMRVLTEREGIGLAELAERIHLNNSTTSGIVDRMEKAGLLAKRRGENDRRAVSLALTEAGADVWRRTDEARLELLSPLLALPPEDVDALMRIHESIVRLFQPNGEGELRDE
ncbi:MarR family transcriptional regulator [Paenibacillus sp.]|uniref:MarR family winged helix-turn-helix transcriptional regulator n=1 Tax=Paenibacillus sp. TaxID=58172 RepID=UPI002D2F0581|nr:MarR family transcriptional regulator [Paenibacillus sp.]HZG57140.1 MarR family transcriptional regulator [Paenibacillus sp.]